MLTSKNLLKSKELILSPSILSVYNKNIDEVLKTLEELNVTYIHLDVMDNVFVPNKTFDYEFVNSLRKKTNMILDTHLMIHNPDVEYINYNSNIITFHFEATDSPLELIKKIKKNNTKAGISIKPNTSVEVLDNLLPYLDLILVMSVEPGFGGQKFLENSLPKIEYLKNKKEENNYNYLIEVDGGINEKTAKLVKDAGCDMIVVGSYLFNSEDIKKTYKLLEEI